MVCRTNYSYPCLCHINRIFFYEDLLNSKKRAAAETGTWGTKLAQGLLFFRKTQNLRVQLRSFACSFDKPLFLYLSFLSNFSKIDVLNFCGKWGFNVIKRTSGTFPFLMLFFRSFFNSFWS